MKKITVLAATVLLSNSMQSMQTAPESKKVPANLLKDCGAEASKNYTCRAFTPEEEEELRLRNKIHKLYKVNQMVGSDVFQMMSEEDAVAVYDAACYKAAEDIVARGGCKQQ